MHLTASVEIPEGMGHLVEVDWDFDEGENFYPERITWEATDKNELLITKSHTFTRPGTYFVTIRVIAERNGNRETDFARIQNLDRTRVIVRE